MHPLDGRCSLVRHVLCLGLERMFCQAGSGPCANEQTESYAMLVPSHIARHDFASHDLVQSAPGAALLAQRVDDQMHGLRTLVAEMANVLQSGADKHPGRLGHLLLQTRQVVHNGFRVLSEAGRLRAEDAAAAAGDPERVLAQTHAWTQLTQRLHHMRLDLNNWAAVETMLRPQTDGKRRPLIEPLSKLPSTAETRELVSDVLFDQIHGLLNQLTQSQEVLDNGGFADIPLAQSLFLRSVHAAKRCLMAMQKHNDTRFLDVGCGAGIKLMSAAPFFDYCDGLEFDAGYVQLAQSILRALRDDSCQVIAGDALEFDNYDTYDVIYFYRPLREDALLIEMEQRIVEQASAGTLLIAPYRGFEHRAEELGCAQVAGQLWLVGASPRMATQLRRAAEKTGTDVLLAPLSNVPLVWDPLIQASLQNGFAPKMEARNMYNQHNA